MATLFALTVVLPLYFLLMHLWSSKRKKSQVYVPPPGVEIVMFPNLRHYEVTFNPEEDADIIKYVNSLYTYVPDYLAGIARRASGAKATILLSDCFKTGMHNIFTDTPETKTFCFDKKTDPVTVAYLDGLSDVSAHIKGLVRADMNRAIIAGKYDKSLSEMDCLVNRTDQVVKKYLESA